MSSADVQNYAPSQVEQLRANAQSGSGRPKQPKRKNKPKAGENGSIDEKTDNSIRAPSPRPHSRSGGSENNLNSLPLRSKQPTSAAAQHSGTPNNKIPNSTNVEDLDRKLLAKADNVSGLSEVEEELRRLMSQRQKADEALLVEVQRVVGDVKRQQELQEKYHAMQKQMEAADKAHSEAIAALAAKADARERELAEAKQQLAETEGKLASKEAVVAQLHAAADEHSRSMGSLLQQTQVFQQQAEEWRQKYWQKEQELGQLMRMDGGAKTGEGQVWRNMFDKAEAEKRQMHDFFTAQINALLAEKQRLEGRSQGGLQGPGPQPSPQVSSKPPPPGFVRSNFGVPPSSDRPPSSAEAGAAEAPPSASGANGNLVPPIGRVANRPFTEDELKALILMVLPEGVHNAKHFGPPEEAAIEARLSPLSWASTYAPTFGSMIQFINSHPNLFLRRSDGALYRNPLPDAPPNGPSSTPLMPGPPHPANGPPAHWPPQFDGPTGSSPMPPPSLSTDHPGLSTSDMVVVPPNHYPPRPLPPPGWQGPPMPIPPVGPPNPPDLHFGTPPSHPDVGPPRPHPHLLPPASLPPGPNPTLPIGHPLQYFRPPAGPPTKTGQVKEVVLTPLAPNFNQGGAAGPQGPPGLTAPAPQQVQWMLQGGKPPLPSSGPLPTGYPKTESEVLAASHPHLQGARAPSPRPPA